MNIPVGERLASGIAGCALLAIGVRRRSLLGAAVAGAGALVIARAITGRCPIYRARAIRKGIAVRRAVTVQATPSEIYEQWRDMTNLPRFMKHVERVTIERDGIAHWSVREGPVRLAWSTEIIEDAPGRRLRWRSLPGGDLRHEATIDIRPAPGDRGTVVEVKLHWMPPGGLAVASTLYGFLRRASRAQLGEDLARFQQLLETGELATHARRVADAPRVTP